MPEFLDLDGAAAILGIDPAEVYRLVRTGALSAVKVNAGWRVERTAALRYKDAH
jgi:helix-turn-helix protein